MGQKSLPRLNRVNTSMYWESAIFYNNEGWLSIKLYLFISNFIKYFFLYPKTQYRLHWLSREHNILSSFSISTSQINLTKHKFFFFQNFNNQYYPLRFQPLKIFLYQLNDKYYILFVYFNWASIQRKRKKRNPLKLIRKTNKKLLKAAYLYV